MCKVGVIHPSNGFGVYIVNGAVGVVYGGTGCEKSRGNRRRKGRRSERNGRGTEKTEVIVGGLVTEDARDIGLGTVGKAEKLESLAQAVGEIAGGED